MVFFSDVLRDGQEGVRSWEGEGGEASVYGFNYKKGIKPPMLASGVESDLNKLMFYRGNWQHVCCIYNKRYRRQRQINKLSFSPNIREVIIGEIGLSEQMTARSFLSTQKWEREGHLYPGWQTESVLLVNKLIFGKVTICFTFCIQSLSSGIQDWLSLCRVEGSWGCSSPYQHSWKERHAWLRCYGLLAYSCRWTRREAQPGIPISPAVRSCSAPAGLLPTSKRRSSLCQLLPGSLPSGLLLSCLWKARRRPRISSWPPTWCGNLRQVGWKGSLEEAFD